MKTFIKYLLASVLLLLLSVTITSAASVLFPYQGGTGTGTAPNAGQIPIGTTGRIYTPANLTAGANITITTSSGGITITGAAGGSGITSLNGVTTSTQTFSSVNDTNVTLTIASSSTNHSFTIGWSGNLSLARGGTNANLTASNGGIFYSTASAGAILSGTATSSVVLLSGANAAPSWSNATYPTNTTANQLLYSSSNNAIAGLATANNGVLITSSGGVPSIGTTLPSGVQTNITSLGTITTGVWNGTTIAVANGGLGLTTSTQGDVLYASAANTWAALAKNTNSTRYLSNTGTSNNPAWAQIDLTNGVTGTLPVGSGGTGATTFGTNGSIVIGNTASPLGHLDSVAVGQVLVSNGTGSSPVWNTRLGLGQAPDANHYLTVNAGTITVDSHLYDATTTWNGSTVSFTGIKLNVNDTASASTSTLQRLQVGGVDKFSVDKTGAIKTGIWNGTTIAVANGGTNGTTAAAAFNNITPSTVTMTDGATITPDLSSGTVQKVVLGGNRTMAAPSNLASGMRVTYIVTQDGTGSRTLTWNAIYKFPGGVAPVLTTTANATDTLSFVSPDGTNLYNTGFAADLK